MLTLARPEGALNETPFHLSTVQEGARLPKMYDDFSNSTTGLPHSRLGNRLSIHPLVSSLTSGQRICSCDSLVRILRRWKKSMEEYVLCTTDIFCAYLLSSNITMLQ